MTMFHTVKQMYRMWWKQIGVASFIVSCLLVLTHILVILWWNARNVSMQVQQQLGVFVYLRDDATERGVKLLEELKQAWLVTTFFSKEDAFRLMAKKLPNVLDELTTYGIENPLPPTIYITYKNQEQYESMKLIIARYDDAISTLDTLSLKSSFQEQTRRASKMVTMMRVLFALCLLLVGWVMVMIGMVISYIVTTLFYRFQQQVELTALLWGSWYVVVAPFFRVVFWSLLIAWLWAMLVTWYGIHTINTYFLDVLETSFTNTYLPSWQKYVWLLGELLMLIFFATLLIHIHIALFLRKSK